MKTDYGVGGLIWGLVYIASAKRCAHVLKHCLFFESRHSRRLDMLVS